MLFLNYVLAPSIRGTLLKIHRGEVFDLGKRANTPFFFFCAKNMQRINNQDFTSDTQTHPPVVQEGAVEEDFIALIQDLFLLFFSLKEKKKQNSLIVREKYVKQKKTKTFGSQRLNKLQPLSAAAVKFSENVL